jgi:hypothetical protein
MSKARNLSDFISDATIDSTEIADLSVTHAKLHTDMNLSSKTLTFAANQISGNSVDGGVISNFASTGIDDNASATAVTILSDGKVGIGTSSPSAKLYINQLSASTGLEVYVNDVGTSKIADLKGYDNVLGVVSRMVVQANGNVGIGDTTPTEGKLVVRGDANTNGLFVGGNSTTGQSYGALINAGTNSSDANFRLYDQTGSTSYMFVRGDGNVGIGTSSPSSELQVAGSSAIDTGILVTNSRNGVGMALRLDNTNNGAGKGSGIKWESGGFVTGAIITRSVGTAASGDAPGYMTFHTSNDSSEDLAERMRIDSSGNVIQGNNGSHSWTADNNTLFASGGIGVTANSDWSLQLAGSTTDRIRFFTSSGGTSTVGNISVSPAGTTYNTTSDRRLKDNIQPIADATDKLMDMKPVTHTWIDNPEAPQVHGFIAQEMQEVVPEAVSGDAESDEMMSMDYGRITPVIVAALQDALKEIKELKTRIAELENK